MPLHAPPALGRWLSPVHDDLVATSQTFTVGRVFLMQFVVPAACRVDGLTYVVAATAAGNVIGGIVGPVAQTADAASAAPVLAQSASTPQGSPSSPQTLTWTAVALAPGIYYAALVGSDATGTYMRGANVTQAPGLTGYYDRAGGYGALTNPTPAMVASATAMPGLRIRLA